MECTPVFRISSLVSGRHKKIEENIFHVFSCIVNMVKNLVTILSSQKQTWILSNTQALIYIVIRKTGISTDIRKNNKLKNK